MFGIAVITPFAEVQNAETPVGYLSLAEVRKYPFTPPEVFAVISAASASCETDAVRISKISTPSLKSMQSFLS